MSEAGFEGTVEVVRGRLSDERGEQILRFWSDRGALDEARGRERLPQVLCVALDESGEVAGVNSAFEQAIPALGGRRFWVYRSALAPEAAAADPEMINAAFSALEAEFDPAGDGAIGLCLALDDSGGELPEVFRPDTSLTFAGFTQDDRQLWVRYLHDAQVEPGFPNAPSIDVTSETDYSLPAGYRVGTAEEVGVTPDDVLALWTREQAMPTEEAERRVTELLNAVVAPNEGLVGLSTAFVAWSPHLRMNLWFFRIYVAEAHRASNVGTQLNFANRDVLQARYLSGEDTRAVGAAFELENQAMRKYFNRAIWQPADYMYIGDNPRGEPIRVHYFPGARVRPTDDPTGN
jgi:hypothetical protein